MNPNLGTPNLSNNPSRSNPSQGQGGWKACFLLLAFGLLCFAGSWALGFRAAAKGSPAIAAAEVKPTVLRQSPRQVWYPLDNGLQFGSLPLPSFLPEEEQRAIIITSWNVGSLHDREGGSGRTHLLAELLRRSHNTPSAEGEVLVGTHRTWFIEKVPPKDVTEHLKKILDRIEFQQTDASLLGRVRGDLLAQQKKQRAELVTGLQDRVLDRLSALQSGPRGQYQLGDFNLDNLDQVRRELFTPANLHIAIVGPHDPAPTLEIAKTRFGKITAGKPNQKIPNAKLLNGEIGVKRNKSGIPGAIIRSWRVPAPGSEQSLALGLLIPRLIRFLDSEGAKIIWEPKIEPEQLSVLIPIQPGELDAKTALLAARARMDAAVAYALRPDVEMSDMQYARKTMGGILGISRVHDETSMYDPMPAAEALMIQRLQNVDERKLVNQFGRNVAEQLNQLETNYISPKLSVTGIVIPTQPAKNSKP